MFPGPWKDSSYYCKHHKHQRCFAAVPGITIMVVSIVRYVRNAHRPKSAESVNRREMRERAMLAQQLGLPWEFWLCWVEIRRLPYVAVCWGEAIANTVLKAECRTKTSMIKACMAFLVLSHYVHIFVPHAPPWAI